MMPVPSSVAPVPRSQLSMWPPRITTSSGFSVPGNLGHGVVDLDGAVAEAVLEVDLDLDRPSLQQPPDQAIRLGGQEGLGIGEPR